MASGRSSAMRAINTLRAIGFVAVTLVGSVKRVSPYARTTTGLSDWATAMRMPAATSELMKTAAIGHRGARNMTASQSILLDLRNIRMTGALKTDRAALSFSAP